MARNFPLFDLVRSMSGREKQHFKKSASGDSKLRYVQLFDDIQTNIKRENSELEEYLKSVYESQYSVLKQYLFDQICDALFEKNQQQTASEKATKLLKQAELLRNRAIYPQALKLSRRARQLATECARYDLVAQSLEVERRLVGANRGKHFKPEDIHKINQLKIEALDLQKEEALAIEVYYQCFQGTYLNQVERMSREKQFEILNNPDFQKISESKNEQARSFFHAAWAQYFHQTDRIEESISELQKIIDLYDGKKGLQQEHPDMLGNMLHNLMGRYYLLHQIEPIRDLIEKLRTELIYQGNKIKRFETFSLYGLLYASKIAQNLRETAWEGILDQFEKKQRQMATGFRVGYFQNRAYYHFVLGEYDEAVHFSQRNFNSSNAKKMPLQSCFSFITLCMTHCELGNHPLVEELTANRLKLIRSSGSDYDFEESLLKCLHFLGKSPLPEKRRSFIEEMIPKLEAVQKNSDFSVYIAFIPWLECQLDGISFGEKVRKLNADLPRIPLE